MAVSEVNLILEFIDIKALGKGVTEAAEKVVDLAHAFSITGVNELACGRLVAYSAVASVASAGSVEALMTEEAVAVEDELPYVAETALTFVSMRCLRFHSIL